MALVVPNLGERKLLEYLVGKSPVGGDFKLNLYTNSVDLSDENFIATSFTAPSGNGYAQQTLTASNWETPTTNTSGITTIRYNAGVTFSFTASVSVQGYYVTNSGGDVLWAEEFPSAPFTLPSTGGDIVIRPQLQLN